MGSLETFTKQESEQQPEQDVVSDEEHAHRLAWLARAADIRRRILESRRGVPFSVEEIDEALEATRAGQE